MADAPAGRARGLRDRDRRRPLGRASAVEIAFDQAGLEIDDHVVIDESLKRPAEVDHLVGDASKAKRQLGWEPETSFEELIRLMVDADYRLLSGAGESTRAELGRARDERKPSQLPR